MVEGEDAVVGNVSNDRTGGAAIAELECAGGEGSVAGVGVVGGEDRGAAAELLKLTDAGDAIGKRDGVGAVDRKNGIIDDITPTE